MHAQKWEYMVIELVGGTMGTEVDFNKLGEEGWELVTMEHRPHNSNTFAYFKRPK